MTYIYLTARSMQNSRYTSVEVMDKAFETKKMAETYKKKHNKEHPKDLLHVTKKELHGSIEEFEYVKTTIVLEDGDLQSIASAKKTTNSLDTPKEQLAYTAYQESSRTYIGNMQVMESSLMQQATFQKATPSGEKKGTRVQRFVMLQKLENQSIESIEQSFLARVKKLQKWIERYQTHPQHLFDHPRQIEVWINTKDPIGELEKETKEVAEKVTKLLEKYHIE